MSVAIDRTAKDNSPILQNIQREYVRTSYPIHTPHVVRIGCQPLATHTRTNKGMVRRMTRYKPYQLTCPSVTGPCRKTKLNWTSQSMRHPPLTWSSGVGSNELQETPWRTIDSKAELGSSDGRNLIPLSINAQSKQMSHFRKRTFVPL